VSQDLSIVVPAKPREAWRRAGIQYSAASR
jgi:hypothetical protein